MNLAAFTINEFNDRNKYLRVNKRSKIQDFNDWTKAVYFAQREIPTDLDDPYYKRFLGQIEQIQQERQELQQQQSSDTGDILEESGLLSSDEPKSVPGKGLKTGSGLIACPNNIIDYVSRLEVLIGGKRAGNNFPEIVNEAANICQRLF